MHSAELTPRELDKINLEDVSFLLVETARRRVLTTLQKTKWFPFRVYIIEIKTLYKIY